MEKVIINKEIKQNLLNIPKLAKMTDAKKVAWRQQTMSLIPTISVYTDFSPLEFGKIQSFFEKFVKVFFIFSFLIQIFLNLILMFF